MAPSILLGVKLITLTRIEIKSFGIQWIILFIFYRSVDKGQMQKKADEFSSALIHLLMETICTNLKKTLISS